MTPNEGADPKAFCCVSCQILYCTGEMKCLIKDIFLLLIGCKKNTSVQNDTLNPEWEAKDVSIPELNYS